MAHRGMNRGHESEGPFATCGDGSALASSHHRSFRDRKNRSHSHFGARSSDGAKFIPPLFNFDDVTGFGAQPTRSDSAMVSRELESGPDRR